MSGPNDPARFESGTRPHRVLVTGGAGFIGAALTDHLLAAGHTVVVSDVADDRRLEQRNLRGNPRLEWHPLDVRDEDRLREVVAGVDRVVHLAAVVGVDEYMKRPREVLDVNILGTRAVLGACLDHGKPVLIASTSEVYGKNTALLHEGADGVLGSLEHTRWSYAVSKSAGEAYARALGQEGLVYAIVRYFNVYGPLIDHPGGGRVISKFIGAMQQGEPLKLVDGGHAVRALCYVDDAVEATSRLAIGLSEEAGFRGRVVNIGRSEAVSMKDLAERMIALSGYSGGTVDIPGPKFFGEGFEEIPHRVPDVSYLREAVGFTATIPLTDGLRRVLEHWELLEVSPDGTGPAPVGPEIPWMRPVFDVDPQLVETLGATLRSGRVTNDGEHLQSFERSMASALGVPDVVAVGSGSAALLIGVRALCGGAPGGKAILPAFTYIATLSAIVHAGLEPIFCDVDPRSWTLDPDAVSRALESHSDVRLVVPVNVYGVPPALSELQALCAGRGIPLLLDNAHGLGSEDGGRRVSPQPGAQAWSLHATKLLPAVEGGLVTSPDEALLGEARRLRGHGLASDLQCSDVGYNARMDELRAAIANHQMAGLDAVLERRRGYFALLQGAARECGDAWQVQGVPDHVTPNGQNLGLVWRGDSSSGADVVAAFAAAGVGTRRYFWPALHQLERWRGSVRLPVTEDLAERVVCVPLHSRMSPEDLDRIAAAMMRVAEELGS